MTKEQFAQPSFPPWVVQWGSHEFWLIHSIGKCNNTAVYDGHLPVMLVCPCHRWCAKHCWHSHQVAGQHSARTRHSTDGTLGKFLSDNNSKLPVLQWGIHRHIEHFRVTIGIMTISDQNQQGLMLLQWHHMSTLVSEIIDNLTVCSTVWSG